ncbi:hypothetical protein RUND412_007572 [Rhizina undulata]
MTLSQKDSSERDGLSAPVSPSGYEYYLMIRAPSDSATDGAGYEKYLLPLDPSLQIDAKATKADDLDTRQVVTIANLLKERNARTVGYGQWVLSGLRMALGSEEFRLAISFCRYGDDFVDSKIGVAVENTLKDSVGLAKEIGVTTTEVFETEIPQIENTPNEVSEEIATVATDEAGAEISGIMIQQPDSFDPDLDSTVGRRSPTPTSDLDSGASTPVPLVIRTEKEIEINELDSIEDATCNILSSVKGSVVALSILKGVLEARKLLMGEAHFRRSKQWEILDIAKGLQSVLGEHILATMYELAQIDNSLGDYMEAWMLFREVLEGRVEVLGKNHCENLEAIKGLEESYRQWDQNHISTERLLPLKAMAKYEMEVRGENHEHTLEAMDLVVENIMKSNHGISSAEHEEEEYLASMVKRRIPVLTKKVGTFNAFVLGKLHDSTYNVHFCYP